MYSPALVGAYPHTNSQVEKVERLQLYMRPSLRKMYSPALVGACCGSPGSVGIFSTSASKSVLQKKAREARGLRHS